MSGRLDPVAVHRGSGVIALFPAMTCCGTSCSRVCSALRSAMPFRMTVLIEHFGLFITMLLTAEVGGEGDRESGEGGELFHRGQETPTGAWSRWACKWEWMLLKVDTLKIL